MINLVSQGIKCWIVWPRKALMGFCWIDTAGVVVDMEGGYLRMSLVNRDT